MQWLSSADFPFERVDSIASKSTVNELEPILLYAVNAPIFIITTARATSGLGSLRFIAEGPPPTKTC
ncbi:hypothetical protein LMG28138_02916 [Pararobbsia alpina]|uniref:Uncharacterized protein n=2 Tax=Pararobbsia alpina TaxID=621374 RepID=A0A6S7BIW7_9BURK|nr:hypothetical protein LMG28138_02916 [Pararobbsia alpina]